jgi:hypothetical protein
MSARIEVNCRPFVFFRFRNCTFQSGLRSHKKWMSEEDSHLRRIRLQLEKSLVRAFTSVEKKEHKINGISVTVMSLFAIERIGEP